MQVKFFTGPVDYMKNIEYSINEWLKAADIKEVADIKFTTIEATDMQPLQVVALVTYR